MNLIFDIDSQTKYHIEESINESTGLREKKYKIRGIFSTIGQKNRNGRIYPMNIWREAVDKYQVNIQNGTFNTLMEWEHPARNNVDAMAAVAKITKLYIDGDYVMGEAVLLNNEKANQIKSLIDNNIKISVSSRGTGNVQGGIVSDYDLITYDLVSDPSDYNASMNGICESFSMKDGIISLNNSEGSTGMVLEFTKAELSRLRNANMRLNEQRKHKAKVRARKVNEANKSVPHYDYQRAIVRRFKRFMRDIAD